MPSATTTPATAPKSAGTLRLHSPSRTNGRIPADPPPKTRIAEPPAPASRPLAQLYATAAADGRAAARLYDPRLAPASAAAAPAFAMPVSLPRCSSSSHAHGRFGPGANDRFRLQEQEWNSLPFTPPPRS